MSEYGYEDNATEVRPPVEFLGYQQVEATATVNVTVHDHVIITETGHYSFKSFGLI